MEPGELERHQEETARAASTKIEGRVLNLASKEMRQARQNLKAAHAAHAAHATGHRLATVPEVPRRPMR